MTGPVVAVTGASGFVGGLAVTRLRETGAACVTLGRRTERPHERSFHLGEDPGPGIFDGVDAVVHCAWDMSATRVRDVYERNVIGTFRLLTAAHRAGVSRIVTISSMSAYDGTRQVYGRAKLDCERATHELGGVSLRLGLVWSSEPQGMAGAVGKLAGLPVLPLLGVRSHQFTVHADDVAEAIRIAVTDPALAGTIGVAHPRAVPISELFPVLATLAGRESGPGVPVPWRPVYAGMRAAEAFRIKLPLRSDSVLGLVRPAPGVPRADEWARRSLQLRPFGAQPTRPSGPRPLT